MLLHGHVLLTNSARHVPSTCLHYESVAQQPLLQQSVFLDRPVWTAMLFHMLYTWRLTADELTCTFTGAAVSSTTVWLLLYVSMY